jgi:hypothetical protein
LPVLAPCWPCLNTLISINWPASITGAYLWQKAVYSIQAACRGAGKSRFYPVPEGRQLFAAEADLQCLIEILNAGGKICKTVLTEQYSWRRYIEEHGEHLLPLFAITPKGIVHVFSTRQRIAPQKDWTLLSLVSAIHNGPVKASGTASDMTGDERPVG